MYIFKWAFGQPVPSNLSNVGILNLGGTLAFGKRDRECKSIASSLLDFLINCSIWSILSIIFFSPTVKDGFWASLSLVWGLEVLASFLWSF